MKKEMKSGFTLLEMIVVILFASLLFAMFFMQKGSFDAMKRDDMRKKAINAMYYGLEEGFKKEHGFYPEKISEKNLKVIDPEMFTDPFGINMGDLGCSYFYEPAGCEDGKCKEYVLRGILEREDEYIKKSRR